MKKRMQKLENLRIRDRLFDVAWVLYLFALVLNLTAWDALDASGQMQNILQILKIVSLVLCGAVILLNFLSGIYRMKWILFYTALLVIFALSYYFSKEKTLLLYFVLFAATFQQDAKRLVALAFLVKGSILLLNLLGSYLGFSVNYLFGEGVRPRFGLGFSWATSSAILFLFLILEYIYLRKDKMRWWEFVILEGINVYFFLMTDSRMAFVLASAVLVFFFVEHLFRNHFRATEKAKGLMVLLPAILAVLTLVVSFLYRPNLPFLSHVNDLLSGRLELGYKAIGAHGVSVFGTPIEWVGYDINHISVSGYNYVDCSYLQILLQYGVLALCACVSIYCLGVRNALKAKDGWLAWVLIGIAVFSITEPRYMNLAFNIFPVLAFAKMNPDGITYSGKWLKGIFV